MILRIVSGVVAGGGPGRICRQGARGASAACPLTSNPRLRTLPGDALSVLAASRFRGKP